MFFTSKKFFLTFTFLYISGCFMPSWVGEARCHTMLPSILVWYPELPMYFPTGGTESRKRQNHSNSVLKTRFTEAWANWSSFKIARPHPALSKTGDNIVWKIKTEENADFICVFVPFWKARLIFKTNDREKAFVACLCLQRPSFSITLLFTMGSVDFWVAQTRRLSCERQSTKCLQESKYLGNNRHFKYCCSNKISFVLWFGSSVYFLFLCLLFLFQSPRWLVRMCEDVFFPNHHSFFFFFFGERNHNVIRTFWQLAAHQSHTRSAACFVSGPATLENFVTSVYGFQPYIFCSCNAAQTGHLALLLVSCFVLACGWRCTLHLSSLERESKLFFSHRRTHYVFVCKRGVKLLLVWQLHGFDICWWIQKTRKYKSVAVVGPSASGYSQQNALTPASG